MDRKELSNKTVAELRQIAQEKQIPGITKKTKPQLIEILLKLTPADETKPAGISQDLEKEIQEVQETPTSASVTKAEYEEQKTQAPATEIETATTVQPDEPMKKHEQVLASRERKSNKFSNDNTVEVSGILDIMSDGTHGVLRTQKLVQTDKDTYISISQVKKFRLREGDYVTGTARLPKENERYFSLLWIKDVNGITVEKLQNRPNFDDLKPVYPDKQMKLEIGQYPLSNRIIDLLAPIGFGQRSMIVAQPKSGKTYLIKDIAKGINQNHPDAELIVVLIGERPEEVTDIERSVKGTVYASNFDESPQNQVQVAELSLQRAKRLVEMGKDVIILMDSLTRLARAYNVALPASGRTLSGGLDPVSLYPSKKFFGAARNFENGASLTIVATTLVDTGSKMDDVIFEEFKGTGNMELKLDRRLANKRVFPAIDITESGTRNEELLLGTEDMQNAWKIRRMMEALGNDANEALIDRMKQSKSNADFLQDIHKY
jgi:transcription termination factor Rho